MTAYNESSGPPVIWRSLFAFAFLEYLNTYNCFKFRTNILVYKLLFFIVFRLSLHLGEFMRFFHFFIPVSVQQWHAEIGTFSCTYILRYHQSCNFFMKGKTIVVGFAFDFLLNLFCNFIILLYFLDSCRYWGKPRTKEELLYKFFFLSLEFKWSDRA